jgi:hypothetical protein
MTDEKIDQKSAVRFFEDKTKNRTCPNCGNKIIDFNNVVIRDEERFVQGRCKNTDCRTKFEFRWP